MFPVCAIALACPETSKRIIMNPRVSAPRPVPEVRSSILQYGSCRLIASVYSAPPNAELKSLGCLYQWSKNWYTLPLCRHLSQSRLQVPCINDNESNTPLALRHEGLGLRNAQTAGLLRNLRLLRPPGSVSKVPSVISFCNNPKGPVLCTFQE